MDASSSQICMVLLKLLAHLVMPHFEIHKKNTVQASSKEETSLLIRRSTFDLSTLP